MGFEWGQCGSALGDIQHAEDHQVLNIDQADWLILIIDDRQFVQSILAQKSHGLAGESIFGDAFRRARHNRVNGAAQG